MADAKRYPELPKDAFAIPETRSYPIHDLSHAKKALQALGRAKDDAERARVKAAVYKRYPQLAADMTSDPDNDGDNDTAGGSDTDHDLGSLSGGSVFSTAGTHYVVIGPHPSRKGHVVVKHRHSHKHHTMHESTRVKPAPMHSNYSVDEPVDMLLKDAPDPEAFGKIRNIVKSAHKWGGDGAVPKFRKIKSVLMSRHPEVIASAFGGDPNVAAAWIKDNWYSVNGRVAVGKHGVGPTYWRGKGRMGVSQWYEEVPVEFSDDNTVELFCAASGDAVTEKDGLVWKVALRTGKWKRNPIPGAKGPLVVDKAFLDELVANFDDNAWEHVTIPLSHADRVDENTGYVRELEVVADPKRKGQYLLKAGMEFTEPDIMGKVQRKSIANVSVGVGFNVSRTEDGKTYGKVLKHIALTNMPWINGLTPFGEQMAASIIAYEEVVDDVMDTADLDLMIELARPAKPKFDENNTHDTIRNKIANLISGYRLDADGDAVYDDMGNKSEDVDDGDEYVPDAVNPMSSIYITGVSNDSVLVTGTDYSDSSGQIQPVVTGWVFGYDVDADGTVSIDPVDEWMPVQKTWIRLSQEFVLSIGPGYDGVINDFPADVHHVEIAADQAESCSGCFFFDGVNTCEKYVADTDPQSTCDSWKSGIGMSREETLLVGDETERGGDKNMEEKTETTEETVTLSREDVDRIVAAKVEEQLNAAKEAAKAEAVAEREALELELSHNRRAVHQMKVEAKIAELNASGYTPDLVKKVEEFLLADDRQSEALHLSREDAEVKLSVTDVIEELLPLIERKSLVSDQPKLNASKTAPATGDDPVDAGNKLYDELFGVTP